MSVDDYDIISILGNNINSTTYKVKHKRSSTILVWRTHVYEHKTNADKEYLLDKIKKRSDICHPNILNFYNHIDQKENKIIYLLTEFCGNGSLRDMVDSCLESNTYISEELVCRILYQVAFAIKTIDYVGKISTKEIFMDDEFNAKLFNFEIKYRSKTLKEVKMCQLGLVLYEICTLTIFNGKKYEEELIRIENIFSHSLLSLITCLIKDKSELKKNVDKLLCHPTVLLKSVQWHKEKSFINIETLKKPISSRKEIGDQDEIITYTKKLEKLKMKESLLQIREQEINEREYKLIMKERKIVLMEKAANEKIQQAELYLKHCKQIKLVSCKSSKSIVSNHTQKTMSHENLDSTYVSCGDSILLPTSSKLNVNKIVKPAPFTRTLSERRIRFKGHSPLKDIDFNKRKNVKQSKSQKVILFKKKSDWLTCSEETDKSSIDGNPKRPSDKPKQLFLTKDSYKNDKLNCDTQCKPIIWTEESKKYAFELLRTMNVDKENRYPEVKHTCL